MTINFTKCESNEVKKWKWKNLLGLLSAHVVRGYAIVWATRFVLDVKRIRDITKKNEQVLVAFSEFADTISSGGFRTFR